jgi:hypothetical protein
MSFSIAGIYEKCDAASREELKNTFLRLVTTEPVNVVRTALAGVVAKLAKAVFVGEDDWQELFEILMQLIQSDNAPMRALCFNLLAQVIAFAFLLQLAISIHSSVLTAAC